MGELCSRAEVNHGHRVSRAYYSGARITAVVGTTEAEPSAPVLYALVGEAGSLLIIGVNVQAVVELLMLKAPNLQRGTFLRGRVTVLRPCSSHPGARSSMSALPKLIAFDLDGTLWWPEMYMLSGGAPFKRSTTGAVYDSAGEQVKLMGASFNILKELATNPVWKDTKVAYVSRTEYPEWALPCMKVFHISEGVTMFDVAEYKEIYPGSKRQHFRVIQKTSQIPYEDMLFFDNENWNCTDCAPLGITCVYTPRGMTESVWKEGLSKFAAAAQSSSMKKPNGR